ncbi:signal peptide peptidase SppA [Candidatus Woesearchaeota archaeon]|nr:signal peptide peptidase SppA [Candidatus Woesearchaeota archaeon]
MKKKQQQLKVGGRWAVVVFVILSLGFISLISSLVIGMFLMTSEVSTSGNVAHIKVIGPILPHQQGGLFAGAVADSDGLTKLIEKADANDGISAILIEINSPGGTAVASYEIADAVKKTNKTTVAWIRGAGASGAYWIASATDHIIANPMSITGSIGVTASYLEFSGTIQRYNASYQRLVSGEYKDMGTPFRKLSFDEEQLMQDNIDEMRNFFVKEVAFNRGLDYDAIDAVADGRFYLGTNALELGLVDQLGGKEEAIEWIENKEGIKAELSEYRKPRTLTEVFTEVMSGSSFSVGRGIGSSIKGEQTSLAIVT